MLVQYFDLYCRHNGCLNSNLLLPDFYYVMRMPVIKLNTGTNTLHPNGIICRININIYLAKNGKITGCDELNIGSGILFL